MAKFKFVDAFNTKRVSVAQQYTNALKNVHGIVVPASATDAYHVFHQYTLRVSNEKRDDLRNFLKDKKIDSMVYHPIPLHNMKLFSGRFKAGSGMNVSEQAAQEVLSLPIEPFQDTMTTERVAQAIKEFYGL